MRYIFRPWLFDYDNDIEKVMPTTLVKTCSDKLQNNTYSVFLSAWQIGKPSPCWTTISRSSYPVFFRVTPELYTSVFKPKQYWIEGWGGGLLFSVFRRCFCGVKLKKKIDGTVSSVLSMNEAVDDYHWPTWHCFPCTRPSVSRPCCKREWTLLPNGYRPVVLGLQP